MDEPTTYRLTLSREEFYLLAALLQLPQPLGLRDPFQGLGEREVRERLEKAKESLARREYAEDQADGSVALDVAVVALVQTATTAERSVMLSFVRADGSRAERFIHLTSDLLLEQESAPDDQLTLTAVRDGEVLAERTRAFLSLADCVAAPGPKFSLGEADFSQAQELALGDEVAACTEHLMDVGVPDAAAMALGAALSEGQQTGSVVVWERAGDEARAVASLGWLIGAPGGWILRPVRAPDAAAMEFMPAAKDEIEKTIQELVRL